MRAFRSVLTCAVIVVGLAACDREDCSLPRTGDEQSCDSYDGGQWSFVVGDPLPDLSAYCASQCVDVFAPVVVAGYDDLRKVPLLPKVRLVNWLAVNMDGLKDLRGLEKVDVVRNFKLMGQNGDSSPKTLEGLFDEVMEGFSIEQTTGLAGLEGAALKRVESLLVSRSSVQQLDLSGVQASYVNVTGNDDLRSISFASGEVKQVYIHANSSLAELSWGPGFTVRDQVVIDSNTALSSCLVQQFVDQTDAGRPRMEFTRNNGPCP